MAPGITRREELRKANLGRLVRLHLVEKVDGRSASPASAGSATRGCPRRPI
jgi:hypothetical protein